MTLALLLVLAAAPTPHTWQFETDGTPEVEVANVEGSIAVEGVAGNQVQVEARREGSSEQQARHPLRVVQEGDTIEVQVCCNGVCGGEHEEDEDEVKGSCRGVPDTHWVLKVPRGSRLKVAAVESPVKVAGVEGRQELASVNGQVEVRGSREQLEVATVSGDLVVEPREVAPMELATVSGDVKLRLPAGAGARVKYGSVSGRFNGRTVVLGGEERTYGAGGPTLEVGTVSGRLEVQAEE